MEEAGLLESTKRLVDGKLRRLYRATAQGHRELAAARIVLAELVAEVLD
jgi:DNA-binding PadR family transcriptional regulator